MNPQLGGPCQGIRNIVPFLMQQGIVNEVVCLDPPNAPYLGKDSFSIIPLGPAKTAWDYSSTLSKWLLNHVNNYHVVIIHGLWLYHSYATMKVLRALELHNQKRPKVFIMPHGMLDPWFQKALSRRLKAIRNEIYWRLIERQVVNQADGLLFTCEEELLLARTTFKGYQPKQELNIGYGIAPPPAHTAAMDEAFRQQLDRPVSTYWLYLSRIHEKKGLDLLLSAYQQLWNEQTNIPDLVIAGPGIESAFGQHIAKMIANDPILQKYVHVVGMLTGDTKWGALYNCEAFVLPSHQENFGIAVVEALACGKPVLISNQVNIWREIEQTGTGIVDKDDLDGIFQTLKKWILLSSSEKEKMRGNAYKCYQQKFHITTAAIQLIEVLGEK